MGLLGYAKLEKALFRIGVGEKKTDEIYVQFNPTQLEISRSMKVNKKAALMKDSLVSNLVASSGGASTLKLSLQFDSYSSYGPVGYLAGAAAGKLTSAMGLGGEPVDDVNLKVNNVVERFKNLVRYEPKLHRAPWVEFVWGENLDFWGVVSQSDVKYTMFERDGTPVRAVVSLVIMGDEMSLMDQNKSKPFESPDRTKTRFLAYGEQLWALADTEYGDAGKWKVIAEANGILNPRALGGARSLKVPSIR